LLRATAWNLCLPYRPAGWPMGNSELTTNDWHEFSIGRLDRLRDQPYGRVRIFRQILPQEKDVKKLLATHFDDSVGSG